MMADLEMPLMFDTPIRMAGVREHSEGYPVELRRNAETGRLAIVARNEGGHNFTEVDLFDLIDWLRQGPENNSVLLANG
jgi:hypothetical protein